MKIIYIKNDDYSIASKIKLLYKEELIRISNYELKGSKFKVWLRGQDDNLSLTECRTYSLDSFLKRVNYPYEVEDFSSYAIAVYNSNTGKMVNFYRTQHKHNDMVFLIIGLKHGLSIGNTNYDLYIYRKTRKKNEYAVFYTWIMDKSNTKAPSLIKFGNKNTNNFQL